jgi:diguanylate cyclase (GGDEF)-like protein
MNETTTNTSNKSGSGEKENISGVSLLSSIKFKSWLGILFLTIIPLFSVGYYSFDVLTGISRNLLIESNIQAFQQVKYEVDQYVSMYEDLAKFLANDSRLKEPHSQQAAEALRQLDQSYEYVKRIVLCTPDGNLLQHSKPVSDAITSLNIPEKILVGSKQTIMFSPEAFLVKAPVKTASQSYNLITTISFLKLRKSLEGITFGTNFHYYLVTKEGENLLDQPEFPQELISDLMQRPCGAYDVLPLKNSIPPQLAISLPILHYNLRIFVFQNAGEVYAFASKVKSKTLNFVILIAILALILGTYLSIKLTAPVIDIAQKARELSEGNLDVRVKADRNDELGFLARCFNQMARKIRNKVFELTALYRVSQIINSSATYQQALDDCLGHLIDIFKAQRGSLMLLNEDNSKLRVESYRQIGQIDNENSTISKGKFELEVGEGIAGEVVSSGNPVLSMNCAEDERFKNYDDSNDFKPPQTLVSVPLTVHNTCVGVVNLSDRSIDEPFNNDDLDLLMAIAAQMAMSIDNARLHELTITNSLTGLYIQKYFFIRLDDEIKRARRFSFPLSIVILEIDAFAEIKEKYDKNIAETILREIATMLKDSVRATDIPCHYSGNDFAVILAHTNSQQAMIFAERLRERIAARTFKRGKVSVQLTVSIGLAEYDETIESPESLVKIADKAASTSRQEGGNQTTQSKKEQK